MANADTSPEPSSVRPPPAEPAAPSPAWQPITPPGVAAFASARIGRLLIVQLVVAALAAGAVCWFLSTRWFPIAKQSIRQLPETGGMTNGVLLTPFGRPGPLAQNRFIAFVLDPQGRTGADVPTDVLVTFRRSDLRICSLFGCAIFRYERTWQMPFTRVELEAAWGAWRTTVLITAALATIVWLFASWILIATLAAPAVRLWAFFKDRRVSLLGSWKLSSAALLPGALVVTGLIVAYGLGFIDLVRFLVGWALHFLISLLYLALAPRKLPAIPEAAGARNPFAPPQN